VQPAPASPALDLAAALVAGIAPRHHDDLEIVEGIGPRIAALLRGEGIATWRALAACSPARLREVLALGGPGFRIADPGTWPEQAALAADGRWAELKSLQDRLDAGRR
jgi:predicted flap endonuclease-1-like 5' DNA nuclease